MWRKNRSCVCNGLVKYGPIAQRLVQRTFNPLVAGSNPARPTAILFNIAGWSSGLPRWPHKPNFGGSNPSPATTLRSGAAT